jgi:hypothetical protein
VRQSDLPKAYKEVTYDAIEPEALFLAYPWPR